MEASSDTHHTSTDEIVVQTEPSSSHAGENSSETDNTAGDSLSKSSDVLAKGLSSILSSVITDFDFRAQQTLISQNHLSSSIDRLTGGIFFLLFSFSLRIFQHCAQIEWFIISFEKILMFDYNIASLLLMLEEFVVAFTIMNAQFVVVLWWHLMKHWHRTWHQHVNAS